MKIAIIGAGASGIAAALQAAWRGADVALYERNETIGRKLLVTGSGRCNISNAAAAGAKYACADTAWMDTLLGSFGVADLLGMLAGVGIPVRATPDGWYYPLSESAHSVVAALGSALELAGVRLVAGAQVTTIDRGKKKLRVGINLGGRQQSYEYERVLLAAGGKAYPTLGSRGELFAELEKLGHTVLPKRPALAPVLADTGPFKPLEGLRFDAGVRLLEGEREIARAAGNLIFTPWGLNGPPVMDVSHHISARPNAGLELSLDFLHFVDQEFEQLLAGTSAAPMPLRVFLGAFFAPRAAELFAALAGLDKDTPMAEIGSAGLNRLDARLRDTRLAVKGVRGFEYCQVSAGGVPVGEVDPSTMESTIASGLYLAGETLDVTGPCGGYNLQFAFSSGALAGIAASTQATR